MGQQIAHWLKQLGMDECIQRFAENDIDFTILGDLTDQDLEKIGVTSLGHRRKLLRAIADLKGAEKSAPGVAVVATPRVADTAERRQITVMFSDLVSSTALSARRKTYERSSRPIRSASRVPWVALAASSRTTWAAACSFILVIPKPMRTMQSGRWGPILQDVTLRGRLMPPID